MKQPKVIFLDAVGTLFGVRGSVGEVYGAIAQGFGVVTEPKALNLAFYQSFKESEPLVVPGLAAEKILDREF